MKSLTLGVFLFFAAEITFSQVPTSDQHEVQQTLIKVFEALSARDAAALRKLCTADVRFNEYGDAWTIDTLISKAITKNTAPDFKRVNKLDFISTTIQGDVAWTTYNLHSAVRMSGLTGWRRLSWCRKKRGGKLRCCILPGSLKNSYSMAEPHTSGKKRFREYFLEFLMIFIAVSLGFFAENLRETIKDNQEIAENMNSILTDLESDVAHLTAVLDINTYSYQSTDSLIDLLHHDIGNTAKIYLHARAVTANVGYSYSNSKTFDQLKASGMLKLIPRNLLDSLGLYYVSFRLLSEQDNLVRLKQDAVHRGNYALFDSQVFSQMKVSFDSINVSHTIVQAPAGRPGLLSTDYKTINEVALYYYYLAATQQFGSRATERQIALAKKLIVLIRKEYDL